MSIIRNIQFVSFRDLKIAYFLQGKALQEINCFRSLQETNLYVPSKTHDICCMFGLWIYFLFYEIFSFLLMF